MPASGPVSSRSSPTQAIDQRRLAGVRPADDGDPDRTRASRRPPPLVNLVVDLLARLDRLRHQPRSAS